MVGALRLTAGDVFAGDFEVRGLLAEGGMGAVYAVVDRTCGEERALKVLLPELVADESTRRRFAQEARIAEQLESPYVPRTHRVGIDAATGMPWIAMELLRGRDLRSFVQERGALPVEVARPILEQLSSALGAAHGEGLVHRDLKPENVFLEDAGGQPRVKLLDFGVAKIIDVRRTSALGTAAIGSPLWMAPEQSSVGGRIAPSTDVFALGLIAFYLLTGRIYWRSAHDGRGVGGLVREMLVDDPVPASIRARELAPEVRLPHGFDDWFARAVVREASARFRDAAEASAALRAVLDPRAADRSDLAYATTMEVPVAGEIARALGAMAAPDAPGDAQIPPTDPPSAPAEAAPMPDIPRAAALPEVGARRTWPWIVALLAAGLIAACLSGVIAWVILTITTSEPRPMESPGVERRAVEAPPALARGVHAGTAWRGTYVCGNDVVHATVRIDSIREGAVGATLLAGQDARPLDGRYDASSGRLVVHASDGAEPGGFDGHVSASGSAYRGRTLARQCAGFTFSAAP